MSTQDRSLAAPAPSADDGPLPAEASIALTDVLAGPRRDARVLGASPAAVWLAVEGIRAGQPGAVVTVVAAGAVRLPNALVVAVPMLGPVHDDRAASVGEGGVRAGPLVVRAARWWDPHPRLPRVGARLVARRAAALAGAGDAAPVVREQTAALGAAAAARDVDRAGAAASAMLGLGPGLTPCGDDVVAGLVATLVLLPRAVDAATGTLGHFATALGALVVGLAAGRTTALSAALLAHAARGEVAQPVARLLLAVTGSGSVDEAVRSLRAVGHTSGAGLLAGVCLGVDVTLGRGRHGPR